MKPTPYVFGLLLAGTFSTANAGEIYSELESQSFSEIAPIAQLLDDLEGPAVKEGDIAFTHNQVEIGYRDNQWEYSVFLRYDYLLNFNSDTAELAYLDKNDLPVPQGRTFNVDLRPNHMRARGLGLGYTFDLAKQHRLKIRGNYLQPSETTQGALRGQLTTLSNGYEADLKVDYSYSRDSLLDRPEESVDGHGLSLDLDYQWQAGDVLLQVEARDILSWIHYKDLTYTRAVATTNTISYDANGRLNSIPTVQGIESNRSEIQHLPRRFQFSASQPCSSTTKISCRAELFTYDGKGFPRLGIDGKAGKLNWQADYDFVAKAVGLGVKSQYFTVKLRTDDIRWEDMYALELLISASVPL
ncbi:hypothetical protein [Spongiibacter pelagi]|nr:hypothetical protein [Spongiibacter pelagi]